jgi:magnesium-transporting ATPase (P-type)
MAGNTEVGDEITSTALKQLASSPAVAVALFIMWLCGIVLSFAYIENNDSFKSGNNQKSWFFNLAIGFLPGSIVMIAYHAFCHGEMLSTLEGLDQSALPSALILAGISCLALILKVMKS